MQNIILVLLIALFWKVKTSTDCYKLLPRIIKRRYITWNFMILQQLLIVCDIIEHLLQYNKKIIKI